MNIQSAIIVGNYYHILWPIIEEIASPFHYSDFELDTLSAFSIIANELDVNLSIYFEDEAEQAYALIGLEVLDECDVKTLGSFMESVEEATRQMRKVFDEDVQLLLTHTYQKY